MTDGFVEALLAAPIGVALLARLEERGADVDEIGLGELLDLAVLTGMVDVGPWISEAAANAAEAYRRAEARRPVAEAVARRFDDELHRPIDLDAQEWWTTDGRYRERIAPLFVHLDGVYGAGQLTWAGLWTVGDPPEGVQEQLVGAWELEDGTVSRWHLPVHADVRVFEVHRPEDWARLVVEHPRPAAADQEGWELPGRNQDRRHVEALAGVPGQRALRYEVRRHLVPDWRSVAEAYDGVHLSWAGFLTSEGCVTDLDRGDVAMLRYWFSERTLWLRDVFGEPAPMAAPHLPLTAEQGVDRSPVDVRVDAERRGRDERALRLLLGRALD